MSSLLSRLAAVGLLITAPVIAILAVTVPILARHAELDEQIAQSERLLASFDEQAAKVGLLQAELTRLRSSSTDDSGLLSGDTDALAGAGLQNTLKRLVENAGGTLQSLQVLRAEPEGALTRIIVRAQVSIRTDPLQRVVHDIEAGTPFLFIDDMEIRQERIGLVPADPDTAKADISLIVQLDVYGYMRTGQAS